MTGTMDPTPAPLPPGATPDPGPHPRDAAVEAAGRELHGLLGPLIAKYSLTATEFEFVLGVLLFRQIQALCLEERRQIAAQGVA